MTSKDFWYNVIMTVVIKEFGLASSTSLLTKVFTYRHPDTKAFYFVYFEWVYPSINRADFNQIVGYAFEKFYQDKKFKQNVSAFSIYLLNTLKEHSITEVDINFVLGRIKSNVLRVVRFGQLDLFLYKQNTLLDLSKRMPENMSLANLQYKKFAFEPSDMLLVSNYGVLSGLIEEGLVVTTSAQKILNDLEDIKDQFLETKLVLMLANFSNQGSLDIPASTIGANSVINADMNSLKHDSKESKSQDYKKHKEQGLDKSFVGKLKENESQNFNSELGGKHVTQSVTDVGMQELKKVIKDSKETITWFFKGSLRKIKGFTSKVTDKSKVILQKSTKKLQGLKKKDQKVIDKSVEKVVQNIDNAKQQGQDLQDKAIDKQIELQNKQLGQHNEHILQHNEQIQVKNTNNFTENKDTSYKDYDAIEYFRLKRTFLGRLKLKLHKLDLKTKFSKVSAFIGKNIKIPWLKRNRQNRLESNTSDLKASRFNKKMLVLGFIVVAILGFFIMQWIKVNNYKKQDKKSIAETRKVVENVRNIYSNLESDTEKQKQTDMYNTCFTEAEKSLKQLETIKNNMHFVKNQEEVDKAENQIKQIKQDCHNLYNKVFNVKTLDDFSVLKDFKASFGEQSNVTGLSIYKGVLVVTDKGRSLVYQVNTENGKIITLSDTKEVVKQPYKVAFGESTSGAPIIFVCDQSSGILHYSSEEGFQQISGTDAVAVGAKCASIGGFATNVYFTTENGDILYKSVNIGGSYSFPKSYITVGKSTKLVDFSIDGAIYTVQQYLAEDGYTYDIVKYFGGKKDNFIIAKSDKLRLQEPFIVYTNASGYKPLYIYDKKAKVIHVLEKPTTKKHPGVGVFVKTYDVSNIEGGNITDFAVSLSVNNNKEYFLYILANDKLYKARLK